ncbi:uncharacterized protein K02A2.6-like [Ornithodoros turicata]|uniref:uncharacterized protein K02A2.6-like n=1 Tax=Ornithodoros turicata TaxID=34597 RepID=UPI003139C59A
MPRFHEFKPEEEFFEEYLERFQIYASINDLTAALKKHYSPSRSLIAERTQFHRRYQQEGESLADFAVALKRLAHTCEFGSFLDESLRDRFVAGCRRHDIQQSLMELDGMSKFDVYKVALAKELAGQQSKVLQHSSASTTEDVHRLRSSRQDFAPQKQTVGPCFRCGSSAHTPQKCPLIDAKCFKYGKEGHVKTKCVTGQASGRPQSSKQDFSIVRCNSVTGIPPVKSMLKVEGKDVEFEIDTGSAVTLMPEPMYCQLQPSGTMKHCDLVLQTFTGDKVPIDGVIDVSVESKRGTEVLPLVVVKQCTVKLPVLLGRNLLKQLKLDWQSVFYNSSQRKALQALKPMFPAVFNKGKSAIEGFTASLAFKDNVLPVFCKHRNVPFAFRESVEKELTHMVEEGVLTPVKTSDWATPLVVVPKPEGKIRICGDYSVSINPNLRTEQYPLPRTDELFATFTGCRVFTVLDLRSTYLQLNLDEQAQKVFTVNTHLGLFEFTCLPYGVSSAPAIFQATMDKILHGLPKVACYIDDLLIEGVDYDECFENVKLVLDRLAKHSVQLNVKSKFFVYEVKYLGFVLDKDGLRPSPDKVKAITEAPAPSSVTALRSFLGMLNMYARCFLDVE